MFLHYLTASFSRFLQPAVRSLSAHGRKIARAFFFELIKIKAKI
jgi:hypothetical protein